MFMSLLIDFVTFDYLPADDIIQSILGKPSTQVAFTDKFEYVDIDSMDFIDNLESSFIFLFLFTGAALIRFLMLKTRFMKSKPKVTKVLQNYSYTHSFTITVTPTPNEYPYMPPNFERVMKAAPGELSTHVIPLPIDPDDPTVVVTMKCLASLTSDPLLRWMTYDPLLMTLTLDVPEEEPEGSLPMLLFLDDGYNNVKEPFSIQIEISNSTNSTSSNSTEVELPKEKEKEEEFEWPEFLPEEIKSLIFKNGRWLPSDKKVAPKEELPTLVLTPTGTLKI